LKYYLILAFFAKKPLGSTSGSALLKNFFVWEENRNIGLFATAMAAGTRLPRIPIRVVALEENKQQAEHSEDLTVQHIPLAFAGRAFIVC
jgi:hypothetical protein